jgi:hypothetical protein
MTSVLIQYLISTICWAALHEACCKFLPNSKKYLKAINEANKETDEATKQKKLMETEKLKFTYVSAHVGGLHGPLTTIIGLYIVYFSGNYGYDLENTPFQNFAIAVSINSSNLVLWGILHF